VLPLEENGAEAMRGGAAFNDEGLSKVRQCEDGRRSDGRLERHERRLRLGGTGKSFLAKEGGEGRGNGAKFLDELAVVSCKAEETTHRPCRTGHRPVGDGLHLGRVHGDAGG
jgi:hypothetical protein